MSIGYESRSEIEDALKQPKLRDVIVRPARSVDGKPIRDLQSRDQTAHGLGKASRVVIRVTRCFAQLTVIVSQCEADQ